MKKRVLPLFLALVLCLGLLPLAALAADSDFVIKDGVLTRYTGHDSELVIPDGVTAIGNQAFEFSSLHHVTIPDGVTTIGNHAFYYGNLESITISASVTSIGRSVFDRCIFLESVTILNGDAEIGDRAFTYYGEFMDTIIPGLTVYAPAGGKVEAYCEENGITFVALGETSATQPEAPSIPESGTSYTSTQAVSIDGKEVTFHAYKLVDENGNDTNFVRLRDIAAALNGTAAQFAVGYDEATDTISLEVGKSYTAAGGELTQIFTGDQAYKASTSPLMIDGKLANLTAITLTDANGNDSNYFKLRDLGKALGFNVGYDDATGIFIQSDQDYTDAD